MRKQLVYAILCTAAISGILAGCSSKSSTTESTASPQKTEAASKDRTGTGGADGKTFAIVTKAAGNPYNEKNGTRFSEGH